MIYSIEVVLPDDEEEAEAFEEARRYLEPHLIACLDAECGDADLRSKYMERFWVVTFSTMIPLPRCVIEDAELGEV